MPPSGRSVLLTGGAGFIGSHLARALCREDEVYVVDNLYRQPRAPAWLETLPGLRFVRADVRDLDALRAFVPKALSHIVHAAAVAGVETVQRAATDALRSNLEATLAVASLAESLPQLEHVLFLSSSEVYGTDAGHTPEDEVRPRLRLKEPRWSYAVGKLSAESLLLQLGRERGIPVTVVRPFNVYGPGQIGEGAVHTFALQALQGWPLVVRGSGRQRRAWCYVDDFVDGLLRALEVQPAGEILNLGNPWAVCTVRELAESVVRLAGSASPVECVPETFEDVAERVPDITRAAALLGFAPQIPLAEGLARTLDAYRTSLGIADGVWPAR